MRKIAALSIVTAVLCWAPFSVHLSPAKTLSVSVDEANARIGRPLTPLSVAGVHRRMYRRAYYGAAAAYGAYRYYGAPAYGAYYGSPAYTGYGYQPTYGVYSYTPSYGAYYGGAPATTVYGDYVPAAGAYGYGPYGRY